MNGFDHPHIIKLIGICNEQSQLSIVMELAKFGQLRAYLHINKESIELTTLILYCYQLNTAMAYLESKNFVHR
jgi:focal adhesion kinase 1